MSSDKLRILTVITSLRMGGAERLITDMLPRLRERGHDAELLLFDGTRTPLYDALEQQGVTIHTLGTGAFQMWNPLHVFSLKRFLKRERYDIVHTHNTSCQLLAAMAAGKDAPILVTTEHNTFNRRRNWRWYDPIDRRMYGKYSHVFCVGAETERNLLLKLGGADGMPSTSVTLNGIDLGRFLNAVPDEGLLEEADKGRHIVLMVAAFREQKDHSTLLKAMTHLPDDYRLWLVGDWVLRPAREKQAAELGIRDRVRFWGNRSDVPAIMAMADVVVLSSHYEGMSLASIEGMASGKPFIASDVEGLHDTVGGAGLLFPHEDDERLAELIRKVCEDKEFAAAVTKNCIERAECFNIDKTVDSYEQIYYKVEPISRKNDVNNL